MKQTSEETKSKLGPEDFPLGSVESRAAARAMLEARPRLRGFIFDLFPGMTEFKISCGPIPGIDPDA